jgi:chromate transporter
MPGPVCGLFINNGIQETLINSYARWPVLFVADCVNVPQSSYGCACGSFPCQSEIALGQRTNSFNQRFLKKHFFVIHWEEHMDKTKLAEQKQEEAAFKEPFSYRKLFISTFLISAFTVGGGFVLIPLMKAKFVDEYGWLKENEALDLVSIAQSAPGVMAANSSIIMGYRMGGFLGSLTALLATVLPPLITLTVISFFYDAVASNPYVRMFLKGMQCGVTAILIKVVFDLVVKQVKKKLALPLIVMAGTFIAAVVFKINIMQIVAVDAIIGLFMMRDPQYD